MDEKFLLKNWLLCWTPHSAWSTDEAYPEVLNQGNLEPNTYSFSKGFPTFHDNFKEERIDNRCVNKQSTSRTVELL